MQHVHPSRLAQVSVNPLLPLSSSSSSSSASSSLSSSTAVAPSPNTLSTAGLAEQRRVAVASKTQFAEGWEPLDVPFKGRGGRRPPPPRDQGWATRTESAASARAQAPSGIAAEAFKVTIEDNSDAVSFKPDERTDPSPPVKPGPSKFQPEKDEYTSYVIARKLEGIHAHSFIIKDRGDIVQDVYKGPRRRISVPDDPDAKIDANIPPLPSKDGNPSQTYDVWTRHSFKAIQAHIGAKLPFYHYSDSRGSLGLWEERHASFYRYKGLFKIVSAAHVKGGSPEARAFIEQRGESKRPKSAFIWKDLHESDWLKVTITRCPKAEQTQDPIFLVGRTKKPEPGSRAGSNGHPAKVTSDEGQTGGRRTDTQTNAAEYADLVQQVQKQMEQASLSS